MQRERMQSAYVPSLREYTARWGITPERVRPGQKVMHPGPVNRGVEIDGRVADSPDSLILQQVRAGLAVRMAVLHDLLTADVPAREAAAIA
jgi:aspartate carbamoyltransferase catalytic subunit